MCATQQNFSTGNHLASLPRRRTRRQNRPDEEFNKHWMVAVFRFGDAGLARVNLLDQFRLCPSTDILNCAKCCATMCAWQPTFKLMTA